MPDRVYDEAKGIDTAKDGGSTVNVTTSSTTIVADFNDRLEARIANFSDTNIWLGFGVAAVVGEGVCVPAGSIWVEDIFTGDITAIHGSTGSKAVGITQL